MIRVSPSIRISLGLMFITITVLLFGNFVGLIPDESRMAMEERKSTAESLAVRCTYAIQGKNIASLKNTMDEIAELNPDILSLGMRNTKGRYIARTGDHHAHWVPPPVGVSSLDNWQVPIYHGSRQWGMLEISFSPQKGVAALGYQISPFILLIIFFAILSFGGFVVFMRRSLRYLDPSSVMPNRVKYALDTLTEAVLLMDTKERIILANSVFREKLGYSDQSLLGLNASELEWVDPESNKACKELPWSESLSTGEKQSGNLLKINTKAQGMRNFVVNCAPVLDDKGKSRGAVVTFDDVTEIEKQSFQLSRMVELLQMSRSKIKQKNRELEILATQDPLTGCLNRRSFYEQAEHLLEELTAKGKNLACIMTDIDLFKSINDTYGHTTGDEVIKHVAETLKSGVRGEDIVCRYGGEEFCILLPNCDVEEASVIAERARFMISSLGDHAISEASDISITASFGVSDLRNGATTIESLTDQADKALYKAKISGRNQVISGESDKQVSSAKQLRTSDFINTGTPDSAAD